MAGRRRIEPGDGELRLEVPRSVVHRLGDGAGAQHDAERIDGAVVDDGTPLRIGLVHGFEHVVVPVDDKQAGDHTRRRGLLLSPSHRHPTVQMLRKQCLTP